MKLTITKTAQEKLAALMVPDQILLIDLDDGIGPLSHKLEENGLSYRLFICSPDQRPASFSDELLTSVGSVYFSDETAFYLDEQMTINFKPVQNRFELRSNQAVLEPSLEIVQLADTVA